MTIRRYAGLFALHSTLAGDTVGILRGFAEAMAHVGQSFENRISELGSEAFQRREKIFQTAEAGSAAHRPRRG